MKIVMVNDCAHVGETLIKYLPEEFKVLHLKRSRRFFDKTFRIAWRILRSKGDVYHVHYLLQDCYLTLKFGKHPIIGHAHGSDLRDTLHSRKWGWIVKYNLRNCDKILVAQPTILETAKEYNETAEYFPIPYDPKLFYPKPLPKERKVKRIFLASKHDFKIKGTDKFLYLLAKVDVPFELKTISYGKDVERAGALARKLGLNVKFIDRVPHEKMNELYWEADLVLGSLGVGQLDTVAIEAMACGRPVIHGIKKKYFPNCPLIDIKTVDYELISKINDLLNSKKARETQISKQLEYVKQHDASILAKKLLEIYRVIGVD
ncbi:MAG: glycosyltransferase [Candidatus Aminicenantes bacterium]|nr:glycosyltransferase [Candidatus Aminicenantes bacterium]